MKIQDIHAREIYDSRGIPTVECDLFLSDGMMVTSSVPSGISCGMYEAVELRDGGDRLMGLGVQKAVSTIEDIIAPMLVDRVPDLITFDLELLDLDQTINKSHLGANALLVISIAVCRAQAYVEDLELYEFIAYVSNYPSVALPCPMFNMLGGGLHADNNFPIQELLIVPTKELSFHEAMETGITVFHTLKKILKSKNKITAIGYEGGFVPPFKDAFEALDILMEAIDQSGRGSNVMISLDVAASHLYNHETGLYKWFGSEIAAPELVEWYNSLISRYPIYSIEDGLGQTDWHGWHEMKRKIGSRVKLIGDDLFVTDPQRIWNGIENDCATSVLIKPNQIGTVTETLQAVALCKDNDWDVVVSHRSGETNDSFIADLAVGVSAVNIKAGGCSRGERMAKYNRLLSIEEELLGAY
ncbi:MAG TPA: phosphopyruvate hydratase [Candidatus Babeliales bacterium]|nr:phosphopyruvate hydratase [Candidatus Babeliales bacterium]